MLFAIGVSHVSGPGGQFKIGDSVIPFAAIAMVYLKTGWYRPMSRDPYDAVSSCPADLLPGSADVNHAVSVATKDFGTLAVVSGDHASFRINKEFAARQKLMS